MKPQTEALLEKAHENLEAVEMLIRDGFYVIAVGRAYYAMLYSAEAVLLEEGFRFSSHGEVHSAFGRELVKKGKVKPELHRYLLDAFRERQQADYQAPVKISKEVASKLLDHAWLFYSEIVTYLHTPQS